MPLAVLNLRRGVETAKARVETPRRPGHASSKLTSLAALHEERLKLRKRLDVLWTPRRTLRADQSGQVQASAPAPEHLDVHAVGHECMVVAAAGDFGLSSNGSGSV